MSPRFSSLSIDHFRLFRRIEVSGLGRVNLITGRNNTGKSTVLEALRILASDASPLVILNILQNREEAFIDGDDAGRLMEPEAISKILSLFHGFPEAQEGLAPIVVAADGQTGPTRVSLGVAMFSEERREGGPIRLVPYEPDLFGEAEPIPALVVEGGAGRRIVPDFWRRYPYRRVRPDLAEETRLPCISVSPYGGERTATLGPLWDKVSLSDREKDVVDALRIIDPRISAVSMVGGEGPRQTRTAIVRADGIPRPVPLRSFGDGLNRLFGIALSLVNAKDGLVLIDEFENGMHHSVQVEAWRAVFGLAQRLNIQVFATSHSWDAIEAFQKAAAEAPQDGVLIRLSRKGEDVVPTLFTESELAVATRDRIEVR